jgi:hypothetical protein
MASATVATSSAFTPSAIGNSEFHQGQGHMESITVPATPAATKPTTSRVATSKQPSYYDPRAVIRWSYRSERALEKIRPRLSRLSSPMSPDDAKKALAGIKRSVASFEKDIRDLDNLARLNRTIKSFKKKFSDISKTLDAIEWEHVIARDRERTKGIRERAEKAIEAGQKVIKLDLH